MTPQEKLNEAFVSAIISILQTCNSTTSGNESNSITAIKCKCRDIMDFYYQCPTRPWHSVADGDLPKVAKDYIFVYQGICAQGFMNWDKTLSLEGKDDSTLCIYDVDYWIEIPKFVLRAKDKFKFMNGITPSLQKKIDYSIRVMQKAERLALSMNDEGFWLAFSGGKDSQVLYHLALMAGVKFKAHMNLTSVDPPEVIRFVRKNYPEVEMIKPKMSIYNMAVKKGILPTMRLRWCCAEYKETSGAGFVTLIGVRKAESVRRSKREVVESTNSNPKKRKQWNFDQFVEHEESLVQCMGNGKEKIVISPILYWTDDDVWTFLNANNIEHCSLYDNGYRRIGCICCPMSSFKQKLREIKDYPHVKKNWIKACAKLKEKGFVCHNLTPDDMFDWWISGMSYKKWYTEKYLQQKFNFKDIAE